MSVSPSSFSESSGESDVSSVDTDSSSISMDSVSSADWGSSSALAGSRSNLRVSETLSLYSDSQNLRTSSLVVAAQPSGPPRQFLSKWHSLIAGLRTRDAAYTGQESSSL